MGKPGCHLFVVTIASLNNHSFLFKTNSDLGYFLNPLTREFEYLKQRSISVRCGEAIGRNLVLDPGKAESSGQLFTV